MSACSHNREMRCQLCKLKHAEKAKEYRKSETYRQWYKSYWTVEQLKQRQLVRRAWYFRDVEKSRLRGRIYQKNNRDKCAKYRRERSKVDLSFRLLNLLRSRICKIPTRRSRNSKKTLELLGCSMADFRIYLESKFEPGMSWENYGHKGWHIDHIMPCAIFDLGKPEHLKRCFHFSNLQPMWATENLRKHRRVTDPQFNLL